MNRPKNVALWIKHVGEKLTSGTDHFTLETSEIPHLSTPTVSQTLPNMENPTTLSSSVLDLLGLKDKDLHVYQEVLRLGSAPLRRIAEKTNLNRGTVYDSLRHLMEVGLVSYVDAKNHRYFTAEPPRKLQKLAGNRFEHLKEAERELESHVIELGDILNQNVYRPAMRFYDGEQGIREILEDVLDVTAQTHTRLYRVYSSSVLRDLVAACWPTYNRERVKRKIFVQAIAVGFGGTTHGLDERRWLYKEAVSPTYLFIYGHKTAHISSDDEDNPFGIIVEDEGITTTQKLIFDNLWNNLPSDSL